MPQKLSFPVNAGKVGLDTPITITITLREAQAIDFLADTGYLNLAKELLEDESVAHVHHLLRQARAKFTSAILEHGAPLFAWGEIA